MRRPSIVLGVLLLALLALMAAKSWLVEPPALRTHSAPGQFDATRAKARLAFILGDQRPHPGDSAADDAVRARLVATLQQMGLRPIVRDQVACNDFQKARLVACARVRNVIATIGPATGKALLLSAHYDSVPVGPGAGDDGVGVATLLEVGSILKQRQLPRPVILLFNEGEELGLVGARAFLADPLSRSVDSLLNFDARGVTGPVTMFETSEPNGAAIAAYAKAVRRPFASSMSTDVARLIPNDTDVTTYKERGWLTLNFAMVGNETRYHSPGDDLAALDPRSLQHMGDQALAVGSELSGAVPQATGERIFFDTLGRSLITMPLALGIAVYLVLLALFAVIAWKRGAMIREPAVVLAMLVLASAAGWLATVIMTAFRVGTYWRAYPEITFVAVYATALFAAATLMRILAANFTVQRLRPAFWLVFLVLGGLSAIVAPGAIIYFLLPPAVVLLGTAASRWYPRSELIGGLAGLLLLYLSWGELLASLEELFSPGPLWIVAPVASVIIIAVVVELQPLLREVPERVAVGFTVFLALLGWAVVAATPAYSRNREQRFTIEHVTQFPAGRSSWSVLNDGTGLPAAYSSLGRWKRGQLPFSERQRWLAEAPAIAGVQPPSLQLVEVVRNGGERSIRIRIKANGADRVILVAPAETHIRTAGVAGFVRTIASADSSGKFTISCTGRSCDGMELMIDEASAKPSLVTLVGARNGLPAIAAPLVRARPADSRPQYTPDETLAISHVKL